MEVRDFTVISQKVVDNLVKSIGLVVEDWSRVWFLEINSLTVNVDQLSDMSENLVNDNEQWYVVDVNENGLAGIIIDISNRDVLLEKVLGVKFEADLDSSSSIITELLLKRIFESLFSKVLVDLQDQIEIKDLSSYKLNIFRNRKNNAVVALININGICFKLYLDATIARVIAGCAPSSENSKPEYESIVQSLGNESISLSVLVGEASIEIGKLSNLSVDDVLVLDTQLNEKMKLLYENTELCYGRLGKYHNRKAIILESKVGER